MNFLKFYLNFNEIVTEQNFSYEFREITVEISNSVNLQKFYAVNILTHGPS